MQDNFTDFDHLMRSMLEDAEVKPSRRVWKGVLSRLDAAEAAAPASWGWMRWAGAGLAFAATLSLGIFFTGTRQQKVPSNGQFAEFVDPAAAQIELSEMETSESLLSGTLAFAGRSGRSRIAQSSVLEPEPAVETVAEEETPVLLAEPSAERSADSGESGKAASRPGRVVRKPQFGAFNADPFAVMASEDALRASHRRKNSALYAKGAIGGNDSDIHFSDRVTMGAPGAQTTGIIEESSSTYGVPFTLGLGVRFYVFDRFSIGTGIDYSLLTRTFTGKYSDGSRTEAGNVLHSLQYLGIPVNLYYDVVATDKLKFYVYGGGEAEYCISNRYRLFAEPDIVCSAPVRKLQYSAGLGVGVEFKLTRLLGLYLDPEMKYYFKSDQPKSIRTDKPLMVGFDAGLRFNF